MSGLQSADSRSPNTTLAQGFVTNLNKLVIQVGEAQRGKEPVDSVEFAYKPLDSVLSCLHSWIDVAIKGERRHITNPASNLFWARMAGLEHPVPDLPKLKSDFRALFDDNSKINLQDKLVLEEALVDFIVPRLKEITEILVENSSTEARQTADHWRKFLSRIFVPLEAVLRSELLEDENKVSDIMLFLYATKQALPPRSCYSDFASVALGESIEETRSREIFQNLVRFRGLIVDTEEAENILVSVFDDLKRENLNNKYQTELLEFLASCHQITIPDAFTERIANHLLDLAVNKSNSFEHRKLALQALAAFDLRGLENNREIFRGLSNIVQEQDSQAMWNSSLGASVQHDARLLLALALINITKFKGYRQEEHLRDKVNNILEKIVGSTLNHWDHNALRNYSSAWSGNRFAESKTENQKIQILMSTAMWFGGHKLAADYICEQNPDRNVIAMALQNFLRENPESDLFEKHLKTLLEISKNRYYHRKFSLIEWQALQKLVSRALVTSQDLTEPCKKLVPEILLPSVGYGYGDSLLASSARFKFLNRMRDFYSANPELPPFQLWSRGIDIDSE